MATIAEMLGKRANEIKAAVGDALYAGPSASSRSAVRFLRVEDAKGRFCSYFTQEALSERGLKHIVSGDSAILYTALTTEKRLRLLRDSLSQTGLEDAQLKETERAIAEIRAARLSGYKGGNEAYIARDRRGLFLGVLTERDARARWGDVSRSGPVIVVKSNLSLREVSKAAGAPIPQHAGYRRRVENSMSDGRGLSRNINAGGRADQGDRLVVDVLYGDDTPSCATTKWHVLKYFGDNWFFVNGSTVQLVLDWAPNEVREALEKASREAAATYEIGKPGTLAKKRGKTYVREPGHKVGPSSAKGRGSKTKPEAKKGRKARGPKAKMPQGHAMVAPRGAEPRDGWLLSGGIRASGIRGKQEYSATPSEDELSREERKQKWVPPVRDTSRFSGSSASRHNANSSYNYPSDLDEGHHRWYEDE